MSADVYLPPSGYQRVFEFLGYGSRTARVWFLGMEEGLGTKLSLRENIEVRARHFDPMMDLEKAHAPGLLNELPLSNPTWRNMSKFMLGLAGMDEAQARQGARDYMQTRLGRTDGDTLLAEMLPLPCGRDAEWDAAYRSWFADKGEYRRTVGPWRRSQLATAIERSEPQVLLAYGKRNWRHFKQMFGGVVFAELRFGGASRTVVFEVGTYGSTMVVLSPFLGNGQVTDVSLNELARYVCNGAPAAHI